MKLSGRVMQWVGSFRSVASQEELLRRFRKSDASTHHPLDADRLFKHIADATPDILYVYDLQEQRLVYVNDRLGEVLGYTPQQIQSMGNRMLGTLLYPTDIPRLDDIQRRYDALADGEATEFQYKVRHADGRYRWLHGRAVVFSRTSDLRAKETLGLVRDITDLKQATDEVKESHELLAATIDALSAHIAMLDRTGTIIAVNEAWRRFADRNGLGDRRHGLGANYLDVCDRAVGYGAEDAAKAAYGIRCVLQGVLPSAYLEYSCHSRVEKRWYQMRALPFGHPSQRGAVITHENVTELKLAEEKLARHRDELEDTVTQRTSELERTHRALQTSERMAVVGTLAAGLGHDLGNLLMPLRIRLESIESKHPPADYADDLKAIRQAAEYLQRLSKGMRLLSLDPNIGEADHATSLHEWWLEMEPIFRDALPRRIKLQRQFAAENLSVRLSPHLLTQAVFNLIHNAGKAMKDQGDIVLVWAQRAVDRKFVRLGVTDNGPGMTDDVKQRCLEPFFTTKQVDTSTGLGLALVHLIVQRAGGSMQVESEIRRGTTFILLLPSAE